MLRALPLIIANSATEAVEAIRLLGEALRLNADYARAHAFRALAYAQIFRAAGEPEREEARAKSATHARRALETANEDATALAYAGFALLIVENDVGGARAALDKAVALNPNSATAYGHRAAVLAMSGEQERAIQDANRALRLSPLDPAGYQAQMALAIASIELRRYDDAVAWAHKVIEGAPPRYPMSYAWLIVAESARGNRAGAEQQLKRLARILPGFGPATLAKLFGIFPEPLRSDSLPILRAAGFVPDLETPS
ncbi:MAG: tetratricopeptide repeat protein [Rhodospirillales bacterium]|nr:MAG: tetratricopeptide repeat protein [Rhodospirillales bacterium]